MGAGAYYLRCGMICCGSGVSRKRFKTLRVAFVMYGLNCLAAVGWKALCMSFRCFLLWKGGVLEGCKTMQGDLPMLTKYCLENNVPQRDI